MLVVVSAGVAPGLALLSYFYLRDQYGQEPILTVFKTFLMGAVITFPIMFVQYIMSTEEIIQGSIMSAFLSAALFEEFIKWFVLFFAIYQHDEFDEPFDGIVYGASISLGFATVENILYLAANGVSFAIGRALLPVSSHALFGVIMGYYLGKAKFQSNRTQKRWLFYSFFVPFLLHGLYDFILLSEKNWLYYILPFMLFLWWLGLHKVKHAHLLTKKHYGSKIQEKNASV
ncbi:protease PrsW [Siminovitchia terrae]|uniref:Protease PrsW n=1 Tax=Siminovitchia terrae TaxID=1914933 RepID=A0A429X4C0_SIMTE|nr:glutamic-type intramembrane protease PrsW [Siminovitchia terrae]RST58210.1 PrsW family intramembrane metalloprotease [Siminovitchia terrae]GIN92050.1 protease PrsW [Siminovitchia terrae]GIN96513.1 protease PrsW [Siminovitchia terrae]